MHKLILMEELGKNSGEELGDAHLVSNSTADASTRERSVCPAISPYAPGVCSAGRSIAERPTGLRGNTPDKLT
jgi:hypothetical protein